MNTSSIKFKIAFACSALFLLVLGIMTALHTYRLKQDMRELLSAQQFAAVSALANAIDDKISLRQDTLLKLADNLSTDVAADQRKLDAWSNPRDEILALFDDFFVISRTGIVLYGAPAIPGRLGSDASSRDFFRDTMASRKAGISAPYFNRLTKHPAIMLTAPVFDAHGNVIAILGGQLDLLKPTLLGELGHDKVGKTGYFYIVTRDAAPVIVMHPVISRILTHTSAKGVNPGLDRAVAGFEGTLESTNSGGVTGLASFKILSKTNWLLATLLPTEEAYAPIIDAERSVIVASVVVALLVATLVWLLVFRMLRPLTAFRHRIEEIRRNPEDAIEITATTRDEIGGLVREFNTMMRERRTAEKAVSELNDVLQRNAKELKQTNHELEQFTYTVSHDLRTPLRAIHGYASALKEDASEHLAEDEMRFLNAISANAGKMGTLIDNLLELSRIGRKAITKNQVDSSAMVADLLEELRAAQTGPQPEFVVHDLMPAYADRALIRQVWENLLTNAVKYSSNVAAPRIEISASQSAAETIFCVKDNGSGFDMQYYDKLFEVFQRLHSDEEFAGTGVGLSIVHRIVTLHEGRIWAESAPGQGATFYFALPKPKE